MSDADQKSTDSYTFRQRVNGEETWRAVWRGQLAAPDFNSKGAASAYLDTCDHAGKLRA